MSNIKALRPQDENLQTMLDRAVDNCGDMKYCAIACWDSNGKMDTYYYASASDLAMASVTFAQVSFALSNADYDA